MKKSGGDEKKKEESGIDVSQLPQSKKGWFKDGQTLYQGCWYLSRLVPNIIKFQQNFQAQNQDIIFASNPKCGTTWMKALLFSIINRNLYSPSETPLLTKSPHDLVCLFEFTLFSDHPKYDLADIPSPRLFATHMPYASLPEQVLSKSRVVYICRNPLDAIVSFWHFLRRCSDEVDQQWILDDAVEAFCRGESAFGPFWDHVLGFWRASLERPDNILFLKYEDLSKDTALHVKRVAEFVGFPFSDEEERRCVVQRIVELCSFENLKSLNKKGKLAVGSNPEVDKSVFFRKGEIGDWVNYFSPPMVEKVIKLVEEKLSGSGLTFRYKL